MKKNAIILSSLVLAIALILSRAGCAQASVVSVPKWLQPTFHGTDPFYAPSVTIDAYSEGVTARLAVLVNRSEAPSSPWVNITAISVVFDWGGNYTLIVSPVFTLNGTVPQAAFTLSFSVPSSTVASNLFLHSYSIYVQYVTTDGPGTFVTSGQNFAVYSTTQAQAQSFKQTAGTYSEPIGGFSSVEARILWKKGDAQVSQGDTAYMLGDFAAASTDYQNAMNDYSQAYTAETTYNIDYRDSQTDLNDAYSNYYNSYANYTRTEADAVMINANAASTQANAATTQAEAAVRQADAALTNAYGWMAFGIGWILIGIGAIIYGLRKPKTPA